MPNTTTELGRRKLVHPDLGYDGGVALEALIETIYTNIGDDLPSRFKQYSAVGNNVTSTYEHNLGANLEDLVVLVYTDTFPTLTKVQNLRSTGYTVAETSGFEKTKIDITTPGSGGPHNFCLVILQAIDLKVKTEALNGLQPTYIPAMVGQVRIDSVYGHVWIASGVSAATDWKKVNQTGAKAVVNSSAGYGTHTTLAAALSDANVVDGDEIIQETSETVNTTISFSKRVRVKCKPGVTFTKGSATTGLSFASGSSQSVLENARFAGFTTGGDKPVDIATGVYIKLLFPTFASGQVADIVDADLNSVIIGQVDEA